MKKLIDAVNRYRNVCSVIESCSANSISVGDGIKTEKHDAYVNMLIACDELEASIYCVCAVPDVRDNGQVIMCVKCGHSPREQVSVLPLTALQ